MQFNFKDILDKPDWRPLAVSLYSHSAGLSITSDMRNDESRHPELFMLASASVLSNYNLKNDGWYACVNPSLANTFGAGATNIFVPHLGPRGTIAAGSDSTKIITSTTWTLGLNVLANRGDGRGFKVRIVGKSSGKTEERWVVANTAASAAAITFWLDSPLSFTPASGDTYEFLSGRVYLLNAGSAASGQFKYYDIITNTVTTGGYTGLPTVGTDTSMMALSEQYVPYNRAPGQGFLGVCTATATAASTLTGHTDTTGDCAVLANEYRNFQIRIVEDTVNPSANGQRRLITSHTAGTAPVYTLSSAWTVTPSSNAKYVIENNNLILMVTGGTGNVYTYNPNPDTITLNAGGTLAADTWSSSAFGARGANFAAGGCFEQKFGIVPDAGKNARHSQIVSFRGGATNTLDCLDIAGAATGTWSTGLAAGTPPLTTFSTGTSWAYAPADNKGRYIYGIINNTQYTFRYDIIARTFESWAQLRYTQGATAYVGNRMASTVCIDSDGSKISIINLLGMQQVNFFDIIAQR